MQTSRESGTVNTITISTSDIQVFKRIRKDVRAIEELAADIRLHGLINPITVMDNADGTYLLVAGLRRLEATWYNNETTIRATVLSPMAADQLLSMEYAENEQRQGFTVSERLEYAGKIAVVERAKANERQQRYAGGRNMADRDNASALDTSTRAVVDRRQVRERKTGEIVAAKAGFSSTTQYDRASVIAQKRPDLLKKVDNGEMSIYAAHQAALATMNPSPDLDDEEPTERDAEERMDSSALSDLATDSATDHPADPLPNDQVARAKHQRLLKNPLYAGLVTKHQEAVHEANLAKGELRFQVEGYQKIIRGHEENVSYMQRMVDRLKSENHVLRKRLGLDENEPVEVNTCSV